MLTFEDELPGLHHYQRALERGLPRWDMRSPQLRARQRKATGFTSKRPGEKAAERVRASDSAEDIIARLKARQARFDRWLESAPALAASPHAMVREIVAEVALLHGVSAADIAGPLRPPHIVAARRQAIAIANELRPDLSARSLGKLFGLDHGAVRHALKMSGRAE